MRMAIRARARLSRSSFSQRRKVALLVTAYSTLPVYPKGDVFVQHAPRGGSRDGAAWAATLRASAHITRRRVSAADPASSRQRFCYVERKAGHLQVVIFDESEVERPMTAVVLG